MEKVRAISDAIKEEALKLGFSDCGFSRAGHLPEDAVRLKEWLENLKPEDFGKYKM